MFNFHVKFLGNNRPIRLFILLVCPNQKTLRAIFMLQIRLKMHSEIYKWLLDTASILFSLRAMRKHEDRALKNLAPPPSCFAWLTDVDK